MSKNLIPQIAQMLGVELGEEFKIKGYDELTYKFDNDGLRVSCGNVHESSIQLLIRHLLPCWLLRLISSGMISVVCSARTSV